MQHASKSGKVNVLLVTDGLDDGLTGTLIYCVKSDASKELKMRNIGDVCVLVYVLCACMGLLVTY